jgi:hypothetical protein
MKRALVVCAVLVAGCGGGGEKQAKLQYERAMRAVVTDTRQAGGTPAALHAAARRLRGLKPPAEVAGPHRDLTVAFDAIADADAKGLQPPDATVQRMLAARRAFAARHYDIGVYGPLSGVKSSPSMTRKSLVSRPDRSAVRKATAPPS